MASNKFDHVIATNILNVGQRIASSQSFRNAGLVLVAVELHLYHISLHLMLLQLVAFLKFFLICQFWALLLLDLLALKKASPYALVHDPLPKITRRLDFYYLLFLHFLCFALNQRLKEFNVAHLSFN